MTDIEIVQQLRLQHEQLTLVLTCIINAVDYRDDAEAASLFWEAIDAGRTMVTS